MSTYTFNEIIQQAKTCQNNVKNNYRLGMSNKWSYYFAKAILNPNNNITRFSFNEADNQNGTSISNQILKTDYTDICNRLSKYVEKNKKLPNYATYKNYRLTPHLLTEIFSRILVYYQKNKTLPKYANANSKVFTKPTETGNEVYDYFVKKTGITPKYIDDVCDWVQNKVEYEFYFDDQKSNKEVIDSKAGNCTDLSQMLSNMADALGYEWKCIHTQCRQSGTGHVYLKLRKGGDWFIRDVACIADESTYCVWCNVDTGAGYQLAVNPSWWLANRQR